MTWLFIALVGPLMYALTNHIDKFLLEKYFKSSGIGSILIFSSVFSIVTLPILYIIDPKVLHVGGIHLLVLVVSGLCNVAVLWCYLIALQYEEASVAVVFYQLVPVFAYILGYFILGEVLTGLQIAAMFITILGAAIISFEIDTENHFKLRKKVIIPMLAAAFFWAIGGVLFKAVALEENVWVSFFWENFALAIIGSLIFVFIGTYRRNFIRALKDNSKKIISLYALNEAFYLLGNMAFSFAYMLAPIALVFLAEAFQPIFVFIIGIILTIFFPRVAVEKIQAKHLWQKIIAICITFIGAYLLSIL
ncbi:MAG: DMT family transporter [bacterium]